MFRTYIGIGLALLLAFAVYKALDFAYEAGATIERAKWQKEKIQLADKIGELKKLAETSIQKDRIVYRDRIKTIERVSDTCVIPPDILRVHADAGIYRE
jgi:hypothetical protein